MAYVVMACAGVAYMVMAYGDGDLSATLLFKKMRGLKSGNEIFDNDDGIDDRDSIGSRAVKLFLGLTFGAAVCCLAVAWRCGGSNGHIYVGHSSLGHNHVGHDCIGHNCLGHNYVDHNYLGHNYVGP